MDTGECVPRQLSVLSGMSWEETCELLDLAFEKLQEKDFDWRRVGVPPRMVKIFCEMIQVSFYMVWRGGLRIKVVPKRRASNAQGSTSENYVVMGVSGDHAFFYEDPEVKRQISKMTVKEPRRYAPSKPLVEKEHLDKDEVVAQWDETFRPGTYWVWAEDMTEVRLRFHKAQMVAKVRMSDEDTVASLHWKLQDGPLEIRSMPMERDSLTLLATGLGFEYRGQSRASLAMAGMLQCLRHGRSKHRQKIQGTICAVCGDRAEEIDHVVRLANGGRNVQENLQAMCRTCHLAKTLSESKAPREVNVFEGVVCPLTHELFHLSPKPPQLVVFFRPPTHLRTVAVDVKRCRRAALTNYPYPIPILSPVDEPRPFAGTLGDYNFLTKEGPTDEASFWATVGYSGQRWYSRQLTEWLIDRGIVAFSDVSLVLDATSHLPTGAMTDVFAELDRALDCVPDRYEGDMDRQRKCNVLALLGLLSRQHRAAYTCDTRTTDDDVLFAGSVVKRAVAGTELTDYIWKSELLTWRTNRGLHQLCLDGEQLAVAEAAILVRKHTLDARGLPRPERFLGVQVDAVHCSMQKREFENLTREAMNVLNPDGTRKFSVEVVKSPTVYPSYPAGDIPRTVFECHEDRPWRDFVEDGTDGYELLRRIVVDRRESVFVRGFGGCGKTTAVQKVCAELEARGERVCMTAYTHLAASRIKGRTLHHFLNKFKTFRGTLVIDEASQVPIGLWAQVLGYIHSGARFIVCGDFVSQFHPCFNQWRLNPQVQTSMAESNALKALCDYNRVEFTCYYRGNRDLYDFWRALIGVPVEEAVARVTARFPRLPDEPRWNLVVSNRHRVALLAQASDRQGPNVLVETYDGPMKISPGARLVGRAQGGGVVNGLFYCVQEPNLLRDELGREICVKDEDYVKFSLADALVYYSSQGRTLDGRVRLHVSSPNLTTTALIVGLQRCTHSDLIDAV